MFTAFFLILALFFLVLAVLIAFCVRVSVCSGRSSFFIGKFFIEVFIAFGNFINAFFGGIFSHLGEFGVVIIFFARSASDFLFSKAEEDLNNFFAEIAL